VPQRVAGGAEYLRLRRSVMKSVSSLVILVASLMVLSPSVASSTSLLGTGRGYCAHAERGGHPLYDHFVSTVGGRVYACGPVPLDRADHSGPAIPPFWPTADLGGYQCTELAIRYLYAATDGAIFIHLSTNTYWDGTGANFAVEVGSHFGLGPAGKHLNGHASSERPVKGDILSEMASPKESNSNANSDAREYGDVGIVMNVTPTRIYLLVQNNFAAGLNQVDINSPTSWSINSKGGGFYYTTFKWFSPTSSRSSGPSTPVRPVLGLPSAPSNSVVMPSSAYSYTVYGTPSLNEYSAAASSGKLVGSLSEGQSVSLKCQGDGRNVKGSSVWDELTNGDWISDFYVDTPNVGTFSEPIPLCATPVPLVFTVQNTVDIRSGPSFADKRVETSAAGTTLDVVCKVSSPRGAEWDYVVGLGNAPEGYEPATALAPVSGTGTQNTLPHCPLVIRAAKTTGNLVINGNFSAPLVGVGSYTLISTGKSFAGWRVVGVPGNVGVVSGSFQNAFTFDADGGAQWLDLTGGSNTETGVTQNVPTSAGTRYTLQFSVGNVFDPGGNFGVRSTVAVSVNGAVVITATNSQGQGTTMQIWETFSVSFTANSGSTTIEFLNKDPSSDTSNGLDNISLFLAGSPIGGRSVA
jgi:hypothetical protein